MSNETIPDIVREMLDYDGEVELFAVRINEAYARLPLLTPNHGAATKEKLIAEHNRLSRAVMGGAK